MNVTDCDNAIKDTRETAEGLLKSNEDEFLKYTYRLSKNRDLITKIFSYLFSSDMLTLKLSIYGKRYYESLMDTNYRKMRALVIAQTLIDQVCNRYDTFANRKIASYQNSIKWKITNYRLNYRIVNLANKVFQFIALIGSISLPFIINISEAPKFLSTIISISIAISIGVLKFYNFREHSRVNYQAAEEFNDELSLYISGRDVYKNLSRGDALNLFMDRIDQIKHKQNEIFLSLEEKLAKEQEIELTQIKNKK